MKFVSKFRNETKKFLDLIGATEAFYFNEQEKTQYLTETY